MKILVEVIPAFNRGGSRYYINGQRVKKHDFCIDLNKLFEKRGETSPDSIIGATNRNGDTLTRYIWKIAEKE